MHFLLKPFYHLIEPLTLVTAGLLVLTLLLFKKQQKRLAWFGASVWLLLFLTTCTALGDFLLASIEKEWSDMPSKWATLPTCDALVVLGGGSMPNATEINGIDMQENSDRITTAIELVRRGKAPFLVLGGGAATADDGQRISESKAEKHWIESWNLVTVPVEDLGICNNTHDEAQMFAAKALAHGWKKVMLVTSASHMHRAAGVFRKVTGLEIVPVACAFRTGAAQHAYAREWIHFPEANAADFFSVWIYETVGWWLYKAKGWV